MENLEEKRQAVTKGFCYRFKNEQDFRTKAFKMFRLCSLFCMSGWTEALNGPTFPDLRQIIQEDLDRASWLFTVTSLGFLVGSAVSGFVFRLGRKDVLFAVIVLCLATAVGAVPWCPYLYLMLIAKFIVGVCGAFVHTGGIAEVASLWQANAGFYMQILHFHFSLGAMISPLVAQSFLAPEKENESNGTLNHNCNTSESDVWRVVPSELSLRYECENISCSDDSTHKTTNNSTTIDCGNQNAGTKVMFAYLITAGLLLLISISFVAASLTKENKECHSLAAKTCTHISNFRDIPGYQKFLLLGSVALLLFFYVGTEMTCVGFLSTFGVLQLGWTRSKGALATSVLWICFGTGRFCGIWVAKFLRTATLLYLFPSLLIISHGLFLLSASLDNETLIMVSVGMVGVSMSVIFPSVITWTTENITLVTAHISSLFVAACSVGVMLFPLLFGYTMDLLSPSWFNYLLLSEAIVWLMLYILTVLLSKHLLKSRIMDIELAEKRPFHLAE